MAQDAVTHIAERNKAANEVMAHQSLADRMVSAPGLAFANAYDRAKAFLRLDSNASVFMRAGALGAVRGAFYGGLVAVAGIALLGSLLPAAATLLTLSGLGAVIFGAKDAQHRLDYHLYSGHRNISDWVARLSGAVSKTPSAETPSATPYEAHIHYENPEAKGGHAEREAMRRFRSPKMEEGHEKDSGPSGMEIG